ncbi:MAG: hypothetical protein WD276_10230 [Actinomycetota bacterium]
MRPVPHSTLLGMTQVMLNAIHAAISAADAVSVALVGRRSADPNHQRTADLLEQVAGASPEIKQRAKQLRTLLAKKNVVEYESRKASAKEAGDALERAKRFFDWSQQTVRRTQPQSS